MNLAKHDAETDMEMNMTPMIDVVFLLIIFFMIITDLSQQELEDLELPLAEKAQEDKPDPEANRPILNVKQNGQIIVRREILFDPADGNVDRSKVAAYLATMAAGMKKSEEDGMPDEPILIRADEFTPFREVQKIMQMCADQNIQIWKVELAAKVPNPEG